MNWKRLAVIASQIDAGGFAVLDLSEAIQLFPEKTGLLRHVRFSKGENLTLLAMTNSNV